MQNAADARTDGASRLRNLDDWLWTRPGRLVALFAGAHVVLWTLSPALSHDGLPIDVVEGYAIGPEWVIGTYKHPALPSWLLEAARLLTGATGWPAYLLSSMSIAATYAIVYLLGRDLVGAPRAAAGTLLLSGIIYFHWVTPEFNHNVIQMPLWAGLIWGILEARKTGSAAWWIIAGSFAAIGLYAKFAMAVLLMPAAIFILADRKCRKQLETRGPWLGLIAFLVLLIPMAIWLVRTNFFVFDYVEARSNSGKAGTIFQFLLKQVYVSGPMYLLVFAAIGIVWMRMELTPRDLARRLGTRDDPLRTLLYWHAAPIMVACLTVAVRGGGMKGAWGTPMLSLSGLIAVSLASRVADAAMLRRIALGASALLLAGATAYAALVRNWDFTSKSPSRSNWPIEEIASRFERLWQERTGQPLRIVGGDLWIAGSVASLARSRPSIFAEANFRQSPWITDERIEREGALFVWWRGPFDPPQSFEPFIGKRKDGTEIFAVRGRKRVFEIDLSYAIVPPGAWKAGQAGR